jgi:four helix bundle protein
MAKEFKYDLEERTYEFALNVRLFIKKIPVTISHQEDGRQLVRSSGSVAANYIEANESLSKKDFLLRIKICRKEAKESSLWLRLLLLDDSKSLSATRDNLIQEATELMKIFGSIVTKTEGASSKP